MPKNKIKVAVYGSLRKGEYNYNRFKDYFQNGLEYLSTHTVKGFDLYDLGAYPGIKKSKDSEKELVVDLMDCSPEAFNTINRMELGAGYEAVTILVDEEPAIIYLYTSYTNPDRLVESGDWSKYLSHEQEIEA